MHALGYGYAQAITWIVNVQVVTWTLYRLGDNLPNTVYRENPSIAEKWSTTRAGHATIF